MRKRGRGPFAPGPRGPGATALLLPAGTAGWVAGPGAVRAASGRAALVEPAPPPRPWGRPSARRGERPGFCRGFLRVRVQSVELEGTMAIVRARRGGRVVDQRVGRCGCRPSSAAPGRRWPADVVVLPHPEGPSITNRLAVADGQVDVCSTATVPSGVALVQGRFTSMARHQASHRPEASRRR